MLNSFFHAPSLSTKPDRDYDYGGFGFSLASLTSEGTVVIKGNVYDGKFQDSINSGETIGYNQWLNVDIANNTISGHTDDGIQIEGDTVNVRVWGNTVTSDHGYSNIASQTGHYGPAYVFRNLFVLTSGAYCFKYGGTEPSFVFHNTCYSSVTSATVVSDDGTGQVFRNNIFATANADILGNAGPGGSGSLANSFDYNLYYRVTNTTLVYHWNGTLTNYDTLGDFTAATGNEAHGVYGNPAYDGSYHITTGSPACSVGVVLPNFNDANSAWPHVGAGADLGFHEGCS